MKGDRVEVVVDTGHGTQTFEIFASRAGRRLEVATARGIVEVTEVTRGGTPVRTGRFMASRVVALVEHPAAEGDRARVEVETTRRMSPGAADGRRLRDLDNPRLRRRPPVDQLAFPSEDRAADAMRDLEALSADEMGDG